jgi:hypothetical protein
VATPAPSARFEIGFDHDALIAEPTWTQMDDIVRVASYTIDRGRAYELDRVDAGRATVTINDTDGVLDPTNTGGDYYGKLQPLKQARLAIWNPVASEWQCRFRGFIDAFEYDFDPSQRVNRVTISLVDLFEVIAAVEMFPGAFGNTPTPPVSGRDVFFEDTVDGDRHGMQDRIIDILDGTGTLGGIGLDSEFYRVFSGNVSLHEATYSAGESAMTAIQDAIEAEFPGGVGNAYCDRKGIFAVHGRYARFDPITTSAATGWDFHDWKAGDGAEVSSSPTDTAHIRAFSMSRDLAKIINFAMASPKNVQEDPNLFGNLVRDDTSIGHYGIRSWSTQDLLTKEGVIDGLLGEGADWQETKRFATYYVENYATPQTRVSSCVFRSMDPNQTGAAANWDFLARCDINDRVAVTIGSPGGGGIDDSVKYFIEGVHEEVVPLNGLYDNITTTLDLSPDSYFELNPFHT